MNVELFCCSGGMAEGFRRAGIDFDFAFDADPDACDSYEANLGRRPVQADVRDLLRLLRAGWRPSNGPVELLVADPPCTPYSRAGKRLGPEDARDMLRETAEVVALLRPREYLIGNVPGLQDATQWWVVQEVIGGLAKHGYCANDFFVLDAADYGVPQHRVRPFWFGHVGGDCLRPPERTHASPEEASRETLPGIARLRPWLTCREALGHLDAKEVGRPVRLRWADSKERENHRPSDVDAPARTLTTNPNSDGALVASRKHPPSELDAPSNGISSSRPGNGASVLRISDSTAKKRKAEKPRPAQGNRIGKSDEPSATVTAKPSRVGSGESNVVDWPWDRPATTITTTDRIGPPGHHEAGYLSPPEALGTRAPRTKKDGFANHASESPARTVRAATRGNEVLEVARMHERHPTSKADEPAITLTADGGRAGKSSSIVEGWPWARPATTVCAQVDRIAPANEHAGQYGPNAIVLSEKAAAILQGFPEGWKFAGKTKGSRWAQLGMAMPPALAEAVARQIVRRRR